MDGSSSGGWEPIEATQVALRPGAAAAADVQIGYPPTALGCVAPTWSVTPPGGGRATSLHEGPVRHGPLPAGPADVCADASIEVSPVYPGDQPRIAPYPPAWAPGASGSRAPECSPTGPPQPGWPLLGLGLAHRPAPHPKIKFFIQNGQWLLP